jgi:hypothetical protein
MFYEASSGSIIHLLNCNLPENAIGVEVGLGKAKNFTFLLKECSRFLKLYGVDQYLPYDDYLQGVYNPDVPAKSFDESKIDSIKIYAEVNIAKSKYPEKAEILIGSSVECASKFEDNTLDFVFLDSYLTPQDVNDDLRAWFPKIKSGGIFSGHDVDFDVVYEEVEKFSKEFNIKNISYYNECWAFIK